MIKAAIVVISVILGACVASPSETSQTSLDQSVLASHDHDQSIVEQSTRSQLDDFIAQNPAFDPSGAESNICIEIIVNGTYQLRCCSSDGNMECCCDQQARCGCHYVGVPPSPNPIQTP